MAQVTYEDVTPIIENTTMRMRLFDGVPSVYLITPIAGYVLHDNAFDTPAFDDEGNIVGIECLGYRTTTASCSVRYDFTVNERGFYTVPESEVPADQIFGVPTDTEII